MTETSMGMGLPGMDNFLTSLIKGPIIDPPIDSLHQELPLENLPWEQFEKLCLELITISYTINDCESYGVKGQSQEGIDIFGDKGNSNYATFQCKRSQDFPSSKIEEAVQVFRKGEWFSRSDEFYLCTSCALNKTDQQSKFLALKDELKKDNITFIKWDKIQLSRILKKHPKIVYEFFGKEWVRKFNGEEALAGIAQEVKFTFTRSEIEEGFRRLSILLESADSAIPGKEFIPRTETADLIDWVSSPLQPKQDPIAILEEGAGLGKTAILKDVLLKLRNRAVPVVALKADRLFAPPYIGLKKEMKAFTSIEEFAESIKFLTEKGEHTVAVLIDQLDALSQSLSTNRNLLNSYRELIQDLIYLPGVRLIISCRSFDLETDPLLQSYKAKMRFKVQELDDQTVKDTIAASVFSSRHLSPLLLSLLRVPLHLRIFCQLDAATDIQRITTLQELYNILYEQKVLHSNEVTGEAPVKAELLALFLATIATEMYQRQQLSIPASRHQSQYASEIKYALSHNLLIGTGNGRHFQFFHQSFFDYLFARHFVESGESLAALLSKNQGIFVRSAVRQVLSYLRDFDDKAYLGETGRLLRSPELYRFHIRLLVCQDLGQLASPNLAELLFVKKEVLPSPVHRDLFLEAVRSKGWTKWLCDQGVLASLIQKPSDLNRSEESLLAFLSFEAPALALEELEKVVVDDISASRACSMLTMMSGSKEPTYDLVTGRFRDWMFRNARHKFFEILPSRAQCSPQWTADQLFEILKGERQFGGEISGNQKWEIEEALQKLLKSHPAVAFQLLKTLVEHWVEASKYDRYPEAVDESIEYLKDSEFTSYDPREKYTEGLTQKAYKLLHNYLSETSKEDAAIARTLLGGWPYSKLRTMVKLSASTYLANPSSFVEDIFKLLMRPKLLTEAGINSPLNHYLRELISATYGFFTSSQKVSLHKCLTETLVINKWYKSSHDGRNKDEPKKYLRTSYGELTYFYVAAVPDIGQTPDHPLHKLYQELNRRYGTAKHELRKSKRWIFGDPSPITTAEAERLKPFDWINTFRAYKSSSVARPFDDYEAGLARSFREQMKLKAEKLWPVLEMLLDEQNNELPAIFLEHGLEGLSEAGDNFDATFFTNCLFLGIDKGKINPQSHSGVRLLRSCVKEGACHGRVVELLANVAKARMQDEGAVTGESVDELQDGINCVGGMAAEALTTCYSMTTQSALIYRTLEEVAAGGSGAVRAAAVYQLASLLRLYPTQNPVLNLHIKLIGNNYRLIKASEWSLQYLIGHGFSVLAPLFKEAIVDPFCHGTVARMLTLAWAWDMESAYEHLQFYWLNSSKARVESLTFMMRGYRELKKDQKIKSRQMFAELMVYDDDELRNAFSFCFYHIDPLDFPDWLPLLREFVKTPVSKGREGSFYDFLKACVQDFPAECIELTSYFDSHENPDISRNNLEEKPLELLLGAYQILAEVDPMSPFLNTAMDVFDRMLNHPSYRIGAARKLELVDRY